MRLSKTIILALLILLCSCQKNVGVEFAGSYSYKLGGTIELKILAASPDSLQADGVGSSESEAGDAGQAETETVIKNLQAEIGQIHILSNKDKMIVAIKSLSGEVISSEATVVDNKFKFQLDRKAIRIEGLMSTYYVQIDCEGEKISDILLLKIKASGTIDYLLSQYEITNSNIECIAQLND